MIMMMMKKMMMMVPAGEACLTNLSQDDMVPRCQL